MLDDYLIKQLQAERISESSAKGLYEAIERSAKALGIKPPSVYLLPEKSFNHPVIDGLTRLPNAASLSDKTIVVSRPMLRVMTSENLQMPLSKEMEAIMAHEMHHCANRTSMMLMSRGPVLLMPALAVTGMYLYNRAQKKKNEELEKNGNGHEHDMLVHIDNATKEVHAELLPVHKSSLTDTLLHYGKYMAVAAAGLGVGLYMARHGARSHEFAADRFGARMAGKDAMTSSLRKIHEACGMAVEEHLENKQFKGLMAETILAHPSFSERAASISRG